MASNTHDCCNNITDITESNSDEKIINTSTTCDDNKHMSIFKKVWREYRYNLQHLQQITGMSFEELEININSEYEKIKDENELTYNDKERIDQHLSITPTVNKHSDIALMLQIENSDSIMLYLDSKELTELQTSKIYSLYLEGRSIQEITKEMLICSNRIKTYLSENKLSFLGKNGEEIFNLIMEQSNEKLDKIKLINKILSNDKGLQDLLAYKMKKKEPACYIKISEYFERFDESKLFLDIRQLSPEEKEKIRNIEKPDIGELSNKYNVVETLIEDYVTGYEIDKDHLNYISIIQARNIMNTLHEIGPRTILCSDYRQIYTNTYNNIIEELVQNFQVETMREIFSRIIPIAFYYLKCNMPFNAIHSSISSCREGRDAMLSVGDLFNLLYQQSDYFLKAICIDNYSVSNPIPLYYPVLKNYSRGAEEKPLRQICKELWYSVTEFRTLISFGLGNAGWNSIGKSYLLNLMFGTDFEVRINGGSIFHAGSIDVQMTRNLSSNKTDDAKVKNLKWAYIDCHGPTELYIVKLLCKHLKVILIHLTEKNYNENKNKIVEDLASLVLEGKNVYIFIRDCEVDLFEIDIINNCKHIRIPNFGIGTLNNDYLNRRLREFGREILSIEMEVDYKLNRRFIENIMNDYKLGAQEYNDLSRERGKIEKLIRCIRGESIRENVSFEKLSYYPTFVRLMSNKHRAVLENDIKTQEELNLQCAIQFEILRKEKLCNVAKLFYELISDQHGTLLLRILSQELAEIKMLRNYTIEILWREAILSGMYLTKENEKERKNYNNELGIVYSRFVQCGEPFELIQGDNLVFFSKEIDSLLSGFHANQSKQMDEYNSKHVNKITKAPLVISIIGSQSSGKSTLMNIAFGCKFLTSSGRCTRGVNGSIFKLDRPVNNSDTLLILDTEGLDAIERGNTKDTQDIHFDRSIVLFCLSVSHVVIINLKGDIGYEVQNLLQMCANSLMKLKTNRTVTPKIFFVLNQQADPDVSNHMNPFKLIVNSVNDQEQQQNEGFSTSTLIDVTEENLFVLPTAFNTNDIITDQIFKSLYDFEVTKLSPTTSFAQKCSDLKTSIFEQLKNINLTERSPFSNLSDWIRMAGTIWEVIIRYQDIVKYRNIDELRCTEKIKGFINNLIDDNIVKNKNEFNELTEKLMYQINSLDNVISKPHLLDEKIGEFNNIYNKYKDKCITAYNDFINNDTLCKKMNVLCEEKKQHLRIRLLMERQIYEDKVKTQIKIREREDKIKQNMENFQNFVQENINEYICKSDMDLEKSFEEVWSKIFSAENPDEELYEKINSFDQLHSVFQFECDIMEPKKDVLERWMNNKYNIEESHLNISKKLVAKFSTKREWDNQENFFFGYIHEEKSMKDMMPYNARPNQDYLSKSTLYEEIPNQSEKVRLKEWVPKECTALVTAIATHCSTYAIDWGILVWSKQAEMLAASLRSLKDINRSAWEDLIEDVESDVEKHFIGDPTMTTAKVKLLVQELKFRIRIVNHELSYIWARLSNFAERGLASLVFIKAFEQEWRDKEKQKIKDSKRKEENKILLRKYFINNVRERDLVRGKVDKEKMENHDEVSATFFATYYIDSVKREVKEYFIEKMKLYFEEIKKQLNHKELFSEAQKKLETELSLVPKIESLRDNFVINFICERNRAIRSIFNEKWDKIFQAWYKGNSLNIKNKFNETVKKVIEVFEILLTDLKKKMEQDQHDTTCFDSFFNFKVIKTADNEISEFEKTCPFKAMCIYLKRYLDPNITIEQFDNYFDQFTIDFVAVKMSKDSRLVSKNDKYNLNIENYRKLDNTTMFNGIIFNLLVYLNYFVKCLKKCRYVIEEKELLIEINSIREAIFSNAIGCTKQCPSCGKFCEREVHNDGSRCQIMTGHQFSSMGGKVWQADEEHTAVLIRCDDYTDHMIVQMPGKVIKWALFKEITSKEWNWKPNEKEKDKATKKKELDFMKDIWNKFGREILKYYQKNSKVDIKFIRYDEFEIMKDEIKKYSICFVIDGTGSMRRDIQKAIESVTTLSETYKNRGMELIFSVVIYRDHCDKHLLEIFPQNKEFTSSEKEIIKFLKSVRPHGGGDSPEAVLDGLANASMLNWNEDYKKKLIIHVYDAQPHGDFPNYLKHDKWSNSRWCCCCSKKCNFKWDSDVWDPMKNKKIRYYGISTGMKFEEFEKTMKEKLGNLCEGFTTCNKEQINDAVMKIFIKYDHI